jgi:hypothetical protein
MRLWHNAFLRALSILGLMGWSAVALGQGVIFEGLLHTPLGDATLAINSQNQLVIGNFGTRNGDGVSIELGRADSFELQLLQYPPGLPPGVRSARSRRRWRSISRGFSSQPSPA